MRRFVVSQRHRAPFIEKAFSILWLEDVNKWDLLFPLTGQRVPLERGTHVLFDTCNIHGVVTRGANSFAEEDFMHGAGFQMFFSKEHAYSSPAVCNKMGVEIRPEEHWAGRVELQAATLKRDRFNVFTGALLL